MIANKLNEDAYEVLIYDWVYKHDDYVCGHIMRDLKQDECSDLRYWMFYPVGDTTPINAGDLGKLAEFISELNYGHP